ncbi:ZIP family metal transporter [Marinobacter xestospongiae]|uniref:Divalent cation transporter n=1 Tax=Marinobacter xestospongiae TaxID=994319 RepID=A0ABU3W3N4_9GAMM|nr:ZIP family metal transporter [Marinobacter xestospongiae]MDV2081148.1 divalent cation transporter [Marinobacter xestospongiae]
MIQALETNGLLQILLLTLMAGMAMPLGAAIASVERIRPRWLETEVRHSVIAFGGGALLAAVALVLVPEGTSNLPVAAIVACFAAGGITFMLLDRWLAANGTPASQLVAMLSDFVPEALALGATFSISSEGGVLLACIIALQNVPEGFNSYRELAQATGYRRLQVIGGFSAMALLGPVAGAVGYFLLSDSPQVVSGIMLFAAGGILYIIFQDIAPQASLKRHWAPPLGALAGFLLGVIGEAVLSG